jgi:hypothetical protein
MKRQTFVALFVTVNIGMVILQIKKHTSMIGQLYQKQRNEKVKEELIQKKADVMRQLYTLKNPASIKQFAIHELHMQKIALNQIVTATHYEK